MSAPRSGTYREKNETLQNGGTLVPTIERMVRVAPPPEDVWERICDYRSVPAWDPRIASVEKVTGSGGVGTVYRATTSWLPPTTDVRYRVLQWRPLEALQLQGTHPRVRLVETMLLRRGQSDTYVHWMSELFPDETGPHLPQLSDQALQGLGDHIVGSLVDFLERPDKGTDTPAP